MAQHTSITSSTLVRLLSGMGGPRAHVRAGAFADGLSQWTGWTDAIALSAALERPLAAPPVAPAAVAEARYRAQHAACEQLRSLQVQAIARETQSVGRSPLEAGLGFTAYRQCHVARQQAMELAIAPLRERVRGALAACGPAQARLAAVDAVMAQALAPQERRLLGGLPGWLERRYQREAPEGGGEAAMAAYWEALRQELQALLLAELEHRLQPVEGLIAALRPDVRPELGTLGTLSTAGGS